MKQILMKALGLVMIAGALTATSCKKGDAGPQGEKGDSAIANVYYSNWIDVTDWALGSDSTYIYTQVEAPKIDTNILRTGAVHIYWNLGTASDPAIYSLPFTSGEVYITPLLLNGAFQLESNTNYAVTGYAGDGQGQYRYVIIPGGTLTGGRSSINWNNYAEVKAALNIKD